MAPVPTHQRSLNAFGPLGIDHDVPTERVTLDDASWVDVRRDWVRGSDALLDHLVDVVAWRQGRRRMYDRVLDDPRLSCWYRDGEVRRDEAGKPPDPHQYVILEWDEVPIDGFARFRELIKQDGYRATYRAPYRPDYEMTNSYLELDGWCYWWIYPNMLNRERAEDRKHVPIGGR